MNCEDGGNGDRDLRIMYKDLQWNIYKPTYNIITKIIFKRIFFSQRDQIIYAIEISCIV